MTELAQVLITLVYVWIALNILLIAIRFMLYVKKEKLTIRRLKTLKMTIRLNFIYALLALVIGFLLL